MKTRVNVTTSVRFIFQSGLNYTRELACARQTRSLLQKSQRVKLISTNPTIVPFSHRINKFSSSLFYQRMFKLVRNWKKNIRARARTSEGNIYETKLKTRSSHSYWKIPGNRSENKKVQFPLFFFSLFFFFFIRSSSNGNTEMKTPSE